MGELYQIKLAQIVKEQSLSIIHAAQNYEQAAIRTVDVNRPGLQLAGFYDYFDPARVQIVGKVEDAFLKNLSPVQRRASLENLMSRGISVMIVCNGVQPRPEMVEMAEKYDVNLLYTEMDTSELMSQLIGTLRFALCPRQTVHGVMMEVYGEGVLITGDSGIGKSETALDLLKGGHRLIADDAVELRKVTPTRLLGSAPEMIRGYMEVRGVGVVDVEDMFGMIATKDTQDLSLVCHLEMWDDSRQYDRLGIAEDFTDILEVRVPQISIPVRPGRNLAVIIEVAAMNNRQKRLGYNAALELANNHDRKIDLGWN